MGVGVIPVMLRYNRLAMRERLNGQKRPADTVSRVALVARFVTDVAQDQDTVFEQSKKCIGALAGGSKARAGSLRKSRSVDIARIVIPKRWGR